MIVVTLAVAVARQRRHSLFGGSCVDVLQASAKHIDSQAGAVSWFNGAGNDSGKKRAMSKAYSAAASMLATNYHSGDLSLPCEASSLRIMDKAQASRKQSI